MPSSSSNVYSQHFSKSELEVTEKRKRRLATAVPSLNLRGQEGDERLPKRKKLERLETEQTASHASASEVEQGTSFPLWQ